MEDASVYRFEQVAPLTTPAVLAAVAADSPDRPFVISEDGELTYGEMAVRVARLAGQFAALGLRPGERLGILLPNGIRWCATLLGAHAAGLDAVPLNTWYREDELLAVAERARLRVIITQDEIFGLPTSRYAAAVGERLGPDGYLGSFLWPEGTPGPTGLPRGTHVAGRANGVGLADSADLAGVAGLAGVVRPAGGADLADGAKLTGGVGPADGSRLASGSRLAGGSGLAGGADLAESLTALRNAPVGGTDDALLIFTSGSSAEPKAVRLPQQGLVRTAHAIGERQGIRPDDRFWFASPLFFVFGCCNALPNALTHAATLCLQERFEARSALEFIQRQRCTVYYAVAPITRALAARPDLAEYDISALRTGTANATPEDLRLAIEVLGVGQVCNAYGLTEGYGHSTITACDDPVSVRTASQGRVLPTQELRIVSGGAVAGPGEAGEIQIRGAITPGYLDAPGLTGAAFDDGGWFGTGDIGRLDADGRLHYIGRSHEMMKVKGISISPAEVESLLVQHDLVDEAFVFGLATPEGDQSVGCVLVSTVPADARGTLARDVRDWMAGRAAVYKTPATVVVMTAAELPLTPTGKVSKRLLQAGVQAVKTPAG
jgi:fatty-acyl-CoA synthase